MPYEGEPSGATAHQDFIRNPDISAFLKDCEFLAAPDGKELNRLKSLFETYALGDEHHPVDHVLATDGSVYESEIDPRLPSDSRLLRQSVVSAHQDERVPRIGGCRLRPD